MKRRRRGMLAGSVLALVACVAPGSSGAGSPTATGAPTASGLSAGCEYIGARFSPPTGFAVEEHRDPSVAVPRVSLRRDASSRGVLVSIIPRAATSATVTSAQQAGEYFASLRSGQISRNWTGISESAFMAGGRSHPSLAYREAMPAGAPGVEQIHEGRLVLFFPDTFPRDGYYYVFFWTDIHLTGQNAIGLSELEQLISSFVVFGPPATPSKGCAAR